jgi:hypothetical protein
MHSMFIAQRLSVSLALLRFFFCIHCDRGHSPPPARPTVKGVCGITPVYPLLFFISLSIFCPPLCVLPLSPKPAKLNRSSCWRCIGPNTKVPTLPVRAVVRLPVDRRYVQLCPSCVLNLLTFAFLPQTQREIKFHERNRFELLREVRCEHSETLQHFSVREIYELFGLCDVGLWRAVSFIGGLRALSWVECDMVAS